MINRWKDQEAQGDLLALRVYTSRLLGAEPNLVLHGGGNTSVKVTERTFLGDEEDLLYVKGTGWDLATIEREGFAPIRMSALLRLAKFEHLSDVDMVRELRAAMPNPDAPVGSIEAIVHAVLPFRFVDHTHADAILALTNNLAGERRAKELYGERVLVLPYVMPGFLLARQIRQVVEENDLSKVEGMLLLNHGIFTWGETAKASYDWMIALVTEAEDYLKRQLPSFSFPTGEPSENLVKLAKLRKSIAELRGQAVLAKTNASTKACGYSLREDLADLAMRGPVTPDHVIRTKRFPALLNEDHELCLEGFAALYKSYFQRFASPELKMLDSAPRWVVWPGWGTMAFGTSLREAQIIDDIATHTIEVTQWGQALGGWEPLREQDLFAIEYWELEQAKLRGGNKPKSFQGKVALVTGSAAGIGRAILEALHAEGACVMGLDLNPEIEELLADDKLGRVCNVTDDTALSAAVDDVVRRWGGLDIVVSNAGIFTAGANIEDLAPENWNKSMSVNLTSHMRLLHYCVPYLRHGLNPTAIVVGSRNVKAPGAGAASYSVAKAGLTQLVRVASLELAKEGVRVNIIHPDAVFDTKLWTPEALKRSAERYGITVEEYKTRNLMKTEITSKDVAKMVCAMAGPAFAKTTGAQIPVDGGNDRVI